MEHVRVTCRLPHIPHVAVHADTDDHAPHVAVGVGVVEGTPELDSEFEN